MGLVLENIITKAWMILRVLSVSLLYVYDNIVVFCGFSSIRHRFNTFFRFLVFYIKKTKRCEQTKSAFSYYIFILKESVSLTSVK